MRSSLHQDMQHSNSGCHDSLQRIMKEKLNPFPHKIQLCQPLEDKNVERCYSFANEMTEAFENGTVDKDQMWFSDEAHFHLHDYVNKENEPPGYCEFTRSSCCSTSSTKTHCLAHNQYTMHYWAHFY